MSQLPEMPLWVYFERDPDLNNIWVAHILDLDVVTQGDSLQDAIDMATDAAITVLAAAMSQGCEASLQRTAPQEDWDRLWALWQGGPAQQLESIVDREKAFTKMGTQLRISIESVLQRVHGSGDDEHRTVSIPLGAAA